TKAAPAKAAPAKAAARAASTGRTTASSGSRTGAKRATLRPRRVSRHRRHTAIDLAPSVTWADRHGLMLRKGYYCRGGAGRDRRGEIRGDDSGREAATAMNSISAENRKTLMLFSGRAYPDLADEIGAVLGVAPTPTDIFEFASGEIFVRYKESVRGSDAFVIQSMPAPVNTWVMETLIMIDALKRGSAKRITVVLPFYPYARQDKKHRGREPISARLIADLYRTAGANRILTVDLH